MLKCKVSCSLLLSGLIVKAPSVCKINLCAKFIHKIAGSALIYIESNCSRNDDNKASRIKRMDIKANHNTKIPIRVKKIAKPDGDLILRHMNIIRNVTQYE